MTARPVVIIPHGEIREGDLCWREGHLFRVSDVRRYDAADVTIASPADVAAGRVLVRFTGTIEDPTDDLHGTGYSGPGARYGAWADVPATIEARAVEPCECASEGLSACDGNCRTKLAARGGEMGVRS